MRTWQREMDLGIENDLTHTAAIAKSALRCYDCHSAIIAGDRCASCAATFQPAPLRSTIDIDEFVRATLAGAIGDETITDRSNAIAACEMGFSRKVGRALVTQERARIAFRVALEMDARKQHQPASSLRAMADDFAAEFERWYVDGGANIWFGAGL